MKFWVVSVGRSRDICSHDSSKIRGSGWCSENFFAWSIHQSTQTRQHKQLNKTLINTATQLKTEGGVSKFGVCRLEDRRVYVTTVPRKVGGILKVPSRGIYIKEYI